MNDNLRILVVDDDRDLCKMLSLYLTSKGYDVDTAFDGETAMEMVPEKDYSLIILDIMMPGVDGYEVCRHLKIQREYNPIPIIMLSAKSTEQDKIVGLKTGADAYVFKPFDLFALYETILETLRKSQLAREEKGMQHRISFQIESRFTYLEQVNELISKLFSSTSLSPDEIWELKLALHELGINAIEHGNKMNPDKQVEIQCTIFEDRLEFEIEDEGEGFDFRNVADPTKDEGLIRDRGRGIFLVSQLVNEFTYDNNGSKVKMIRHLDFRERKK